MPSLRGTDPAILSELSKIKSDINTTNKLLLITIKLLSQGTLKGDKNKNIDELLKEANELVLNYDFNE